MGPGMLDVDITKTLRSGNRSFELRVRLNADKTRVVIYGPSGSGKTLTLKAIAGLLRPDHGRIVMKGEVLFDSARGIDLPPQARKVGYLFQDYALFPHLDVRQNIGFGLARGWFNRSADGRADAVEHWLDVFHLRQLAHQRPHELSGGQRQRVALARALATNPSALLLDEPFAALDPELRTHLRNELDRLQRHLDIPMLLITHDPADAKMFGDQLVCLRDGMVEDGNRALVDESGECYDLNQAPRAATRPR
jgi:molybdate transport system ATP-binding protein